MSIRKYTMTWADERDRRCVLTMTNTLAGEGDTEEMELLPSDTPFVTSTTPDTNPLTPVRGQTGKVGFIAADGFSIVPTNDHQWRVVLRRESESRTMWTGWLKSETYNQRLWGVNEGVTLNVIDDVEAMKTWTMDADKGFGMVTLRELICECLDHVNGVAGHDTLELEWSTDVSPTSGPWTELFDMKVSRYNFFTQVADSAAHEGKTCHAVLESICKTFGWTLTMVPHLPAPGKPLHDGVKMLFSYAGAKNYMRVSYSFFKAGEWTDQTESSPAVKAIEDLQPCNLHDYSIEPGYRKVKVVSQLSMAENTIPSLSFGGAEVEWVEDIGVKYYRNEGGFNVEHSLPWRVRLLRPKGALVKFPRYNPVLPDEDNMVEVDEELTKGNFDYYLGIALVSHDYWHGPDEDRGSTPEEGEEKRNYSWKESMLMKTGGIRTAPFLTTKSAGSCVFSNGGFEIGLDIHMQTFDESVGMYDRIKPYQAQRPGPLKYAKAMGPNDTGKVIFSLRIGDMFWNGDAWTKNKSTFEVTTEPQQAHSMAKERTNKTLAMAFTTTRHAIPISTRLVGEAELTMYGVYLQRSDGTKRTPDTAIIENMTFGYCVADVDPTAESSAQSHEYSYTGDGWTTDAEGITLDICSDKNDAANYSVLTDKDGKTVKSIWDALEEKYQRPEEALLDKLKAHMTRAREILTLRYTLADGMEPKNRFSIGEGGNRKVYSLLAVKDVDWCSGDAELVLSREP